ncbi:hypothetical protein IFM89_034070 [Coptis chinensis]|uniref:Desiccation-related protein PCC13-62 n=1 Tax=Coptis chinensis TaxID=261450 RepID=A0A835IPP9_9MAGN|nr:hypothetical protein IFM89_034070 [Coptis chinensis]
MSIVFILHLFVLSHFLRANAQPVESLVRCDVDLLQFALNMEYLEAEFFLFGALGYGLDIVAPDLVDSGYPPVGGEKANLQWFVRDLVVQLAYQQIGHLRAIRRLVGAFPRPLMDLSATHFARLMDTAMGIEMQPPFNPYLNDINFLLASYLFPYLSLTSYVGTNSLFNGIAIKRLLAGLVAVEAGQDAMIRTFLYERALQPLHPYTYNVAEITERLSAFRDQLGGLKSNKDEGVIVASRERSNGMSTLGNVINADKNSISFARAPWEILRILYGTGSASKPGGFFPIGANGTIAQYYLFANAPNATICGIPVQPSKPR